MRRVLHLGMGLVLGGCALILSVAVAAAPTNAAPTGHGGWHFAKSYGIPHLRDAVNGLSCPTVKDCFAVSANKLFWTTDARGGKGKWKNAALEPSSQPTVTTGTVIFDDISCVSAHLCVAVDDIGNAFVSTNPTGGKKAWHASAVSQIEFEAVGCSTAGTCAAVDYNGNVFSTTPPAGGWGIGDVTVKSASGSDAGVSCAGNGLCAVTSGIGKIAVTTSPGGGHWHLTNVKGGRWLGISCPTTHRCGARRGQGRNWNSGGVPRCRLVEELEARPELLAHGLLRDCLVVLHREQLLLLTSRRQEEGPEQGQRADLR